MVQAHVALELGLRECFGISREEADEKRLGLRKLLKRAISEGRVRECQFTTVQRLAETRARDRELISRIKAIDESGAEGLSWDDDDVCVKPEDYPGDYLANLLESILGIPNHLAHGSTMVDKASVGFLRTVAEILNQLFAKPIR